MYKRCYRIPDSLIGADDTRCQVEFDSLVPYYMNICIKRLIKNYGYEQYIGDRYTFAWIQATEQGFIATGMVTRYVLRGVINSEK